MVTLLACQSSGVAQTAPAKGGGSHHSSSQWSTADQLQLANILVTGFAGAVAALAAIVAYRALKAQIAAPKRDRRSAYYRAVVLDPALEILPQFESRAERLIEIGEREIREQLEVADSVSGARTRAQSLAEGLKTLLRTLKFRILGSAVAWRDEMLRTETERALEKLEDDLVIACTLLLTGEPQTRTAAEVLHDSVADITGLLVHHDLSLDQEARGALNRLRSKLFRRPIS
jgi:hypothetical protein